MNHPDPWIIFPSKCQWMWDHVIFGGVWTINQDDVRNEHLSPWDSSCFEKIRYSSESWIQKKVNEHQRKAGKGGPNFIVLTSATFLWEGSRLTRALLTSAEADYCDHGLYPSPGRSMGTQFPGSFLLVDVSTKRFLDALQKLQWH